MKNFKKCLILGVILLIIVIYCIYHTTNNKKYEEIIEENVYQEESTKVDEANIIVLHITGEINNPRNNNTKRRSKINRCHRRGRRHNSKCRYK